MNVCRGAGVWSRADIIINITKGSFFVSPEKKSAFEGEYYWVCDTCGKEFSTKEAAVIHEKNECEGLKDAKTLASKRSREEDARRKEEAERRKEEEDAHRKEEAERRKEEAERRKEYQESLGKDKLVNPHLALISDHLWWLALGVKLGLIMMLISIFIMLVSLG